MSHIKVLCGQEGPTSLDTKTLGLISWFIQLVHFW
jgi:hypothetical protein